MTIIETTALTKRFSPLSDYRALLRFRRRETLTAVNAVTLQVQEGELFGLLGPNGAGKTTLVKMLCTLILPSEGQARIAGYDIVAEAAQVRSRIGLVDTQERSFFWRLSGRQNLEFFAALYGLRRREANERIAMLLDLVGLESHAERRFMDYSTGMRQKLAIARGLLTNPPIIFMDEPTRSLDPVSARDLRLFVRETLVEQLGRTVILVTHRLEEAEALCDRVAIMDEGQIIACGPTAEIKQRFVARQRYHLVVQGGPPDVLTGLQTLPGVLQAHSSAGNQHGLNLELVLSDEKQALPDVLRYLVAQGIAIQHCQAQTLSLEEAFMHLVKERRNGL